MMKRIDILILSALCMFTSCVHQFPEDTTPAQLDVTLTFNTDMEYYRTVKYPEETVSDKVYPDDPDNKPAYFDQILPDWQTDAPLHRIRYVVQAHRVLASSKVVDNYEYRKVFYDDDATRWDDFSFSMMLPEGRYELRVWADYIGRDSDGHLYYNPDEFTGVTVNHVGNKHHGNTDFADAYSGKMQVDVVRYGTIKDPVHATVPMARPLGKYVFVTNDLQEFADKVVKGKYGTSAYSGDPTKSPDFNIDDYYLRIICTQFLPISYNMGSDRTNDSQVNVWFKSSLKALDEDHAMMGFDYVLTDPVTSFKPVTKVVLRIELYDKDDNLLASSNSDVYVPLKRSKMTLVEGSFLLQESGGGVSIDPGFNGPDIVVPVN